MKCEERRGEVWIRNWVREIKSGGGAVRMWRLLLSLVVAASTLWCGGAVEKYAVVFDGGSTGSRVHVFRFGGEMDLLPIGADAHQYELYVAVTPGLSSYESEPKAGAASLRPLLHQAEDAVPKPLRPLTPLKLGATAGLRQLPGNASEAILDAVRELFKNESSLKSKPEWVTVLDGSDEGAFMWIAINYLLGSFGKGQRTVGVIDLGGGSVQMAYAISDESAANAPPGASVSDRLVLGTNYHLYAHSYLNYGLRAARAESLKLSGARGNPCVTNGYIGTYEYNGVVYQVSPPRAGTNLKRCGALIRKTLHLDAACAHKNCSFDGVWNGGGGDGLKNLYVASFFYDTAAETGIVEENVNMARIRPIVYRNAARKACTASVDNINSIFPLIDKRDVPFLCMDLVYEYTLLVDGFGISPFEEIMVVKDVEYKGSLIGAAWPLGCAVELVS